MLWFFKKGSERLQCEIRPSLNDSESYELTWTEQNEVHVLRSADVDELAARWLELEERWKRAGWVKVDETAPSHERR
jgi:hypothetical protein